MRSRTDVVVFSTAAAVVGVHAVVDSFIAPEPGTTPADHALRAVECALCAAGWRI